MAIGAANDETAPDAKSGNKVLKVTGYTGAVYDDNHICRTDDISFDDGSIEVDAKASGDQNGYGGGIAWRIVDKSNFYSLRYSAAEGNLNVFKIVDGTRSSVGGGSATFALDKWYHVKLEVSGNTMTVSVDGKQVASVQDNTFTDAGGVGIFQRGSTTIGSWDNFSVSADNIVGIRNPQRAAAIPISIQQKSSGSHATDLMGRALSGPAYFRVRSDGLQASKNCLEITGEGKSRRARLRLSR